MCQSLDLFKVYRKLSADIWGLEEGTYYVMSSQKNVQMLKRLKLYGKYFYVLNQGNIKALIEN